ncbi:Serine/threonine protein kinase [Gracilaria domingensis]|nr:Serine/threonine protein kinase [Gracilaria domingensis]
MHSQRYLHRDIKPENILLDSGSGDGMKVKLADLGLSKRLSPTNNRPHTTYVATRWYRSPEILLHMSNYGYPSDMWAIGAVMAEMIRLGDPLFPGSNEDEQLARIMALRGHPSMVNWKAGEAAMKKRRIRLPKVTSSSLRTVIRDTSPPTLQLISDLLELDPEKRPTAAEALLYPLFVIDNQDDEDIFRSRKRRKVISKDLDTARTREFPPTAFSYQSEDNLGTEGIDVLRTPGRERSTFMTKESILLPQQFFVPVSGPQDFSVSPFPDDQNDEEQFFSRSGGPAGRFDFHVVR